MDTRDLTAALGEFRHQTGTGFDPAPLQALEAELARRLEARDRPYSTTSWELAPAQYPSASRLGSMALWGLVAAGAVAAVAGAVALPRLIERQQTAAVRAPVSRPMASPQALTFPLARSTETVSVQPVRAPASPPAPRALAAVAKPQATLRRPLAEADPAAAAAPAAESATGADASAAVAELVPPKPAPPANDERPGPNFDCAAPGSLAEEMVCQDTRLIAADRALGHALRRAQAGRGAGGRVAAAT